MAEAFLQVLIENLSSLVKGQIGLIMGVDKEMKKLSSTLTTIQAVLEDAEEKQLESKPILDWLRKLNELAYEIDDILDECVTEVSKLQHKNSKSSRYSLKKILYRHKIGRRMKEVTERLDGLAAEREKFHLHKMEMVRPSEVSTTRETCSILSEPEYVYGRDEEKEEIVEMLVNQVKDCQQLSVLPIIGIGGLGKTTLAQIIYNDPRVIEHFDTKLWVCVSENFDLKTLVKAMIESATGKESNLVNLDALQRQLRDLLKEKRYLLVLDDVWNDEQDKWAKLKGILACGARGSSIVVTTRLKKVADIMGTLAAHRLKGLSEEHCWLLFRQRAFGQEDTKEEQYPNLEIIGRQILKKCAGVPLAAKALGGILRFKRKEKEWLYVKESEIWNLPQDEALILPSLRLSYHHLPLQLRQCFAYCAIFPKDYKIEKEELIFCWMAHGYISSNGIIEVEDVGNQVWNELVLRSLFQDVGINYEGKTTFKMHDLVHDLAQSIMENKIPGTQAESSGTSVLNHKRIREVDVEDCIVAFPTSILLDIDVSFVLINFSRLRMLNASGTGIEDLPSAIGNLKRLRYLNLSYSKFHSLPNTICRLWNLQILNLNRCKNLVSLPKHMRYMNNLRHLFLEECESLSEMPPSIGELTSLKTLSVFVAGHERGNQLGELQYLNLGGKLEIRHLERATSHIDANLGEKPNLRDLVLRWELGEQTASGREKETDEKVLEALEPHPNLETLQICGFRGVHFPPWTRMENIIEIHITDCPNCLRLPEVLGDLARLKFLELRNLVALEYVMENELVNPIKTKFPSLETLELYCLPSLKGLLLKEEKEMFPNLHMVDIHKCPLLILPPVLPSLKTLDALSLTQLTLNSISKLHSLTCLKVELDKNMTTCITSETLKNLSNLKKLTIRNGHEHCLPVEGLRGLKSLTELEISNCESATCLSDGLLQDLTALDRLNIHFCAKLVEATMESTNTSEDLSRLKTLKMPDPLKPSKVVQLLYSSSGLVLLALSNNAVHKLWKWQKNERDSSGKVNKVLTTNFLKCTASSVNDAEDSVSCIALSKNDSYMISASGGEVSLLNTMTLKVMTTFMAPPPAATCLALYPQDNNIIAIGMEDSTIQIYNVRRDENTSKLKGHQNRISGLAFSQSLNILVSAGADAQLCIWSTDGWEMKNSRAIEAPPGHQTPLVGDTRVHFHKNQSHLLVVHKTQIAIYDHQLDCLRSWYPLSSAISSAMYSCDGLTIFTGFCDGVIGIFDAHTLNLESRIQPSAYIPSSISSKAFPVVVAAHPFDQNKFAVGMSDGAVYVIQPFDARTEWGGSTFSQDPSTSAYF